MSLVLLVLAGCTGSPVPAFNPENPPELRVVATAADGLATPRDLAFDPASPTDVWTVNRETDAVVILFDAGTEDQVADVRADVYGNHFMEDVSGMAFGQPGTFATVQESRNTYDGQFAPNNFMGPALWPTDLDVLAEAHQDDNLLGSHLDMLHESPLSMGIAWDRANVYWVFDGYHDDLVRYDFSVDHGAGHDDHADGIVRRYDEVELTRVPDVPGHMELDQVSKLLYVADTGTGRVLAVDTTTGEYDRDLTGAPEPLEEYSAFTGVSFSAFATGLDEPSGLALDGEVLYVGEHGSGQIVAYGLDGIELGRLQTDAADLMGLAVDVEHRLWYADGGADEIVLVDR